MYDMGISEGCEKLGVLFMNDSVPEHAQDFINEKANEYFHEAQASFNSFLFLYGFEWEMGVIKKRR